MDVYMYVDAFGDNVTTLITYTLQQRRQRQQQQQQHSEMKKAKEKTQCEQC